MSTVRRAAAAAGHAVRSQLAVRSAPRLAVAVGFAAVVLVFALGGCASTGGITPSPEPPPASPFAACPPPVESAVVPSGRALPELTLECFTGAAPVALAQLQRPAVINLWASWCAPCRDELPALQALADEIGERVLVLGVNTDDAWNAAAWAGIDFGVRYPNLFDPQRSLQDALGLPVLPATLIVAADGSIVATDVTGTLTLEDLRTLVSENIGLD